MRTRTRRDWFGLILLVSGSLSLLAALILAVLFFSRDTLSWGLGGGFIVCSVWGGVNMHLSLRVLGLIRKRK